MSDILNVVVNVRKDTSRIMYFGLIVYNLSTDIFVKRLIEILKIITGLIYIHTKFCVLFSMGNGVCLGYAACVI